MCHIHSWPQHSPRQVRAIFVTKRFWQGSYKQTVCNEFKSISMGLEHCHIKVFINHIPQKRHSDILLSDHSAWSWHTKSWSLVRCCNSFCQHFNFIPSYIVLIGKCIFVNETLKFFHWFHSLLPDQQESVLIPKSGSVGFQDPCIMAWCLDTRQLGPFP